MKEMALKIDQDRGTWLPDVSHNVYGKVFKMTMSIAIVTSNLEKDIIIPIEAKI